VQECLIVTLAASLWVKAPLSKNDYKIMVHNFVNTNRISVQVNFPFQLAYCDTIIQRNSRINLPVIGNLSSSGAPASVETAKPILLDSFFPFDPYRLTKSKVFIEVSCYFLRKRILKLEGKEGGQGLNSYSGEYIIITHFQLVSTDELSVLIGHELKF
jgi:hypothetical protein